MSRGKPIIPIKPGTLNIAATYLSFALIDLEKGNLDAAITEIKHARQELIWTLERAGFRFEEPTKESIQKAVAACEALSAEHEKVIETARNKP